MPKIFLAGILHGRHRRIASRRDLEVGRRLQYPIAVTHPHALDSIKQAGRDPRSESRALRTRARRRERPCRRDPLPGAAFRSTRRGSGCRVRRSADRRPARLSRKRSPDRPTERCRAARCCRIVSRGVLNGTTSEYTFASRILRAISCVY